MSFQLDYENSTTEGITLRVESKHGDQFAKNYCRFGWSLTDKIKISGYSDLYSYIFERKKNDIRYPEWCRLENEFQATSSKIRFRDGTGIITGGDFVNPDYLDYESEQPFVKEYKLTKGKIILNTVMCFALIGFLMWIDSVQALLKNKSVRKIAEWKEECRKILQEAEAL